MLVTEATRLLLQAYRPFRRWAHNHSSFGRLDNGAATDQSACIPGHSCSVRCYRSLPLPGLHENCRLPLYRDRDISALYTAISTSRCSVRWQLRHVALTDSYRNNITKTKHFRWRNILDNMCRVGRWSFWFWFGVNRSSFDEDVSKKTIFTFPSPVTLTFGL